MDTRIDACMVSIDVTIEFEGHSLIVFSLPPDDPLVQQLLDRNNQINLAAARSSDAVGIL